MIPRAQDLAVFLKLLGPQRHRPVAHRLHVFPERLAAQRRNRRSRRIYVVLLDNGRTRLLPDRGKRQSLYCIRCGACLNACPVYRKIGGHSFRGSTRGPSAPSSRRSSWGLARARPALRFQPLWSVLRGVSGKIDIPKILLELRSDVKKAEARDKRAASRNWRSAPSPG